MTHPHTLGQLKSSGYQSISVKDEMRRNLIRKLKTGAAIFDGILGYADTVLPQVQNAILSKHDMLFLGLRGQAKTRMLRQLTHLLDDAIPIIAGSEVNDDPLRPLSRYGRDLIAKHGDDTPIEWITPAQRYHEKLATPDVTIADLIGEIDMIKHAEGRYLSSELTMHFGLIPRSNRGIFCMNELPDLSAKIQVGMFNVLEERDVQIRGYPVRLELDLCMVFSANPEDYTNRGRIVTPLKDRIGSVIRTHYPLTRDVGIAITDANAWVERSPVADAPGSPSVLVPLFMKEILEETARLARSSQAINQQSGVSVRMSIANMENMISNAERRGLSLGENPTVPRISDLAYLAASTRGKIELTLSEDDGQEEKVLAKLLGEAIKNLFDANFELKQFRGLVEWFEAGKTFLTGDRLPAAEYVKKLNEVPVLKAAVLKFIERPPLQALRAQAEAPLLASVAEFILEGLHVQNRVNKSAKAGETTYRR
ncbi:MAG: sigma 54-interacting transcriptional regulator [Planctomycetes bacterium]|nr:sigma 54-interacting transcriptional regulator [Planctomycetota bacterium]